MPEAQVRDAQSTQLAKKAVALQGTPAYDHMVGRPAVPGPSRAQGFVRVSAGDDANSRYGHVRHPENHCTSWQEYVNQVPYVPTSDEYRLP